METTWYSEATPTFFPEVESIWSYSLQLFNPVVFSATKIIACHNFNNLQTKSFISSTWRKVFTDAFSLLFYLLPMGRLQKKSDNYHPQLSIKSKQVYTSPTSTYEVSLESYTQGLFPTSLYRWLILKCYTSLESLAQALLICSKNGLVSKNIENVFITF